MIEEFTKLAVLFIFGFLVGIGIRAAGDALDGISHDANEWSNPR